MKLIVIQHALQADASSDFEGLAESVSTACGLGADVVVCPLVESIQAGPDLSRSFLDAVEECTERPTVVLPFGWHPDEGRGLLRPTQLGATALLIGDEALDPEVRAALVSASPEAIVMRPGSESPLQAEGFIELALALSLSVAALVVIADPLRPESDIPAFGGSCIVVLGEVVAEAESETETELLEVTLDTPLILGHSRPPLAPLPGILEQRWAHHNGMRAPVDYPAELT